MDSSSRARDLAARSPMRLAPAGAGPAGGMNLATLARPDTGLSSPAAFSAATAAADTPTLALPNGARAA